MIQTNIHLPKKFSISRISKIKNLDLLGRRSSLVDWRLLPRPPPMHLMKRVCNSIAALLLFLSAKSRASTPASRGELLAFFRLHGLQIGAPTIPSYTCRTRYIKLENAASVPMRAHPSFIPMMVVRIDLVIASAACRDSVSSPLLSSRHKLHRRPSTVE